jgi:hypothetical protein
MRGGGAGGRGVNACARRSRPGRPASGGGSPPGFAALRRGGRTSGRARRGAVGHRAGQSQEPRRESQELRSLLLSFAFNQRTDKLLIGHESRSRSFTGF